MRSQAPAATVVICAYNSRARIGWALASLEKQDLAEPFEIVAVVSGDDGCAGYLAQEHPDVRVIASDERLYPAAARNAGIAAARAPIIAFHPDDGIAKPDWLAARLASHAAGYSIVAGAIANATPRSVIGTASYYVEYAASIPIKKLLAQQPIPHTLSYHRSVFEWFGGFPELTVPGEDTVFNAQCVAAGVPIAFEPRACLGHLNLTDLMPFLAHQRHHGRGFARCTAQHQLRAPFALERNRWRTGLAVFMRYPLWRWLKTMSLLARFAPHHAIVFLMLTPVVMTGYVAGAIGVWDEFSHRDHTETSTRPRSLGHP